VPARGSGRAKRKATLEKKNTGRIIVATKSFISNNYGIRDMDFALYRVAGYF
jgi:hypothetical protein